MRRGLAGRDQRTAEDPRGDPAKEGRSEHRVGGDQCGPRAWGGRSPDRQGNVGGRTAVVQEVRLARSGARQAIRRLPECRDHGVPEPRPVRQRADAAGAKPLRPHCGGLGLHRVAGNDPAEGALTGRLDVLGELVAGAEERLHQVDRAAGRGDLKHPRFVRDRDREPAGARVEVAKVGDRRRVLGRLPGVRGGHRRAPASPGATPRRVVQIHRAHRQLAHLSVRVSEGELGAADHVAALGRLGAAQRHADVDRHVLARLDSRARRGAAGDDQRQGGKHGVAATIRSTRRARAAGRASSRAASHQPKNGEATS